MGLEDVEKKLRQHVMPRDGSWAVVKDKAERPSKLLDRKYDAIKYAKQLAKNQDTQVVIHRKDGSIQDVLTPRGRYWDSRIGNEIGLGEA